MERYILPSYIASPLYQPLYSFSPFCTPRLDALFPLSFPRNRASPPGCGYQPPISNYASLPLSLQNPPLSGERCFRSDFAGSLDALSFTLRNGLIWSFDVEDIAPPPWYGDPGQPPLWSQLFRRNGQLPPFFLPTGADGDLLVFFPVFKKQFKTP